MYKIPLTNYPNQSFICNVPVNGANVEFRFELWYNEVAGYWLLSLYKVLGNELLFSNLPLLHSINTYSDILCQLGYKNIGMCLIVPTFRDDRRSMPDDKGLGGAYIMVWGDNIE